MRSPAEIYNLLTGKRLEGHSPTWHWRFTMSKLTMEERFLFFSSSYREKTADLAHNLSLLHEKLPDVNDEKYNIKWQ